MGKIIYARDGEEIIVDNSNYEFLNNYNWFIDRGHVAAYGHFFGKYMRVYMKKLVLLKERATIEDYKELKVFHKDENILDNRRENLTSEKEKSIYYKFDDHAKIIASTGEEIIVDLDDVEELIKYKWHIPLFGVPCTSSYRGKREVPIPKIILDFSQSLTGMYYYINGDKLDNRKENLRKTLDELVEKEGCIEVHKELGHKIIVDKEMKDFCENNTITVGKNGYAYINCKGKRVSLHRYLMNPPKEKVVDHINHNPLDNRKENLRVCTHSENNQNKSKAQSNSQSGIRGVYQSKSGMWFGKAQLNNKKYVTKPFVDKEGAEKEIREIRRKIMPFSSLDFIEHNE